MRPLFVVPGAALGVLVLTGMLLNTQHGRADENDGPAARVRQGLEIAPVKLNLEGKQRGLVGLGSYLVNAVAACNDCHAKPPGPFKEGGDPFMDQPKMIDPDHYLGGGQAFGPFLARNITPDKTGKPEGHGFGDFVQIMRTGIDIDKVHPGLPLQVMPWPVYQNMTDHDLRAIYEYLSAIPCLEGGPYQPEHRCK
jgi:hypothetical protein